MSKVFDLLFTNEYVFTFLVSFISVTAKIFSDKHEKISSTLREEAFDFGPELVLISLSLAVSAYTRVVTIHQTSMAETLRGIIVHLLLLMMLIVLLKRISVNALGKTNSWKQLYIPLILGFLSLFLVLIYTLPV